MSRLSYYLPILGYHRVGAHQDDHVPTVSPEAFERQLALLTRWRFRAVGLADVVACLDGGSRLPRHSVVITFDDGYEETHRVAWPLLKRFGFPATVFVMPGEVGLKGFATWQQIIEMSGNGLTIGSHTMHHSYLPRLAEELVDEELRASRRAIEERIGRPVEFLSYPVGGYTPQAKAIARDVGYRAACTTNRSTSFAMDRYALRRIKMTDRDAHPLRLLAKVSGYYDLFRRLQPPG